VCCVRDLSGASHLYDTDRLTVMWPCLMGRGAENDGHEIDGPSKCPGMKLTDMKMTDMNMQDMFQVSE